MAAESSDYVFHSAIECERQERQNALQGIARQLRHFDLRPGSYVLDAGSGSGTISRLLGTHYPASQVIGIDLNPAYVNWARNRAALDGLSNVSFKVGNLQNLPFPDASFDCVWSKLVLAYLPDPMLALKEFRRVLGSGGVVIIEAMDDWLCTNFPVNPSLQERLERVIPRLYDETLGRKLPLMLQATGFANVQLEIELDPIFTTIGAIGPDHRRNIEEGITAGLSRIAEVLGGDAEAAAFLADLLAYLDDPSTCTYSTLWIIKGECRAGFHGSLGQNAIRAHLRAGK